MQVSNLFAIKTFLCILLKTSAQCGFTIMCFISCLSFLTGRKAAFYRCISDGELVGSIAYFAGQSSAPNGWVLCDGAAVSRDTYAALFSAVGTTYGAGDGSTTFKLPNLFNKFIEGSTTAGTWIAPGLPDITGSVFLGWADTSAPAIILDDSRRSGAFVSSTNTPIAGMKYPANANGAIADYMRNTLQFKASGSNTIYGNSTTVQPPALTMKPFIYTGKTSLYKWQRTA